MKAPSPPRSSLLPSVRRLWRFLPLVAILGVLGSLLEGAGIGLFIPLITLLMSNQAAPGVPRFVSALGPHLDGYDPHTAAAIIAGAILGLILTKGVVQAANDSLAAFIEGRIGSDIRQAVARKLLTLDYPFFLRTDSARLSHIVAADCWFVQDAAHFALTVVTAAAGLLVFAGLLAWLNLKLFLLVLLGAGAAQALLRLFEKRQKQLGHEFTRRNRLLWERLMTVVQAPRVIRMFGQQEREDERASISIDLVRENVVASQKLKAVVQPSLDTLLALLFLTVLLAGYWSGMSLGAITVFLILLIRAQPHARTITTARFSMARLRGSMAEVEWLLSQPSAPMERPATAALMSISEDLVFDNVSYAYPCGNQVFSRLSAKLPSGTGIAILGESGSGKTTLVNLLCRLLEPQSGTIRLGDKNIDTFDALAWRSRIAVAGQDSELVTGTVRDNITYARPDAPAEEVAEAVHAAGAERFIEALPQGFDTRVGPNGLSLSGGERQRIGLARALLARPDLLVLDEATNAVDAATEAEIMDMIANGAFCRTLIVISHRKLTLGRCEFGIVLQGGRVSHSGSLRELAYFRAMAGEPH